MLTHTSDKDLISQIQNRSQTYSLGTEGKLNSCELLDSIPEPNNINKINSYAAFKKGKYSHLSPTLSPKKKKLESSKDIQMICQ